MGTWPSGDATLCGTGGAPGDGGCSPPAPIPTACTLLRAHPAPSLHTSPPCTAHHPPARPRCVLHLLRAPTLHPSRTPSVHPSCTLHLFRVPPLHPTSPPCAHPCTLHHPYPTQHPPCTLHPFHAPVLHRAAHLHPSSTPYPSCAPPPAPIPRPAHEMQCAAVITQPGAMRVPPQVCRKVPSRSYCSEICSGGTRGGKGPRHPLGVPAASPSPSPCRSPARASCRAPHPPRSPPATAVLLAAPRPGSLRDRVSVTPGCRDPQIGDAGGGWGQLTASHKQQGDKERQHRDPSSARANGSTASLKSPPLSGHSLPQGHPWEGAAGTQLGAARGRGVPLRGGGMPGPLPAVTRWGAPHRHG